jgi:uncharacterized phiE125 gp8 family phage protein
MAPRRLVLITPPATGCVTLAQFKTQLRDYGADSDAFLQAILDTAINQIDPAGGGWVDRALRPQTWELRMPSFFDPCVRHASIYGAIQLPYPPLTSVVSIKYDDAAGVERALVENTDFRVLDIGGLGKQSVAPLYGACWPTARCDVESVRIRFTAGYPVPTGNATDTLPAPIVQAVLLMAKALYDLGKRDQLLTQDTVIGVSSRGFTVTDEATNVMRKAAENLLSTYRVFS